MLKIYTHTPPGNLTVKNYFAPNMLFQHQPTALQSLISWCTKINKISEVLP